jgi:hypothetical protein
MRVSPGGYQTAHQQQECHGCPDGALAPLGVTTSSTSPATPYATIAQTSHLEARDHFGRTRRARDGTTAAMRPRTTAPNTAPTRMQSGYLTRLSNVLR